MEISRRKVIRVIRLIEVVRCYRKGDGRRINFSRASVQENGHVGTRGNGKADEKKKWGGGILEKFDEFLFEGSASSTS